MLRTFIVDYDAEHRYIKSINIPRAVDLLNMEDEEDENEPTDDVEYMKAKDYGWATGHFSASSLQSKIWFGVILKRTVHNDDGTLWV